jgi:hypothetical protein
MMACDSQSTYYRYRVLLLMRSLLLLVFQSDDILYNAGMQVHISEITAASLMSNSRLQFVDGPGVLPEVSCTLIFKLTDKVIDANRTIASYWI